MRSELEHLRNIIEGAKKNQCEAILRKIVRDVADEAPLGDLVRIAEIILQCGIDQETSSIN